MVKCQVYLLELTSALVPTQPLIWSVIGNYGQSVTFETSVQSVISPQVSSIIDQINSADSSIRQKQNATMVALKNNNEEEKVGIELTTRH